MLTPDPVRRGARTLAAAQAKYQAGAFGAALDLADAAELGPLDELGAAKVTLLRGEIRSISTSTSAGLPLLLDAAKRLEPLDAGLARSTYRDALHAAINAVGLTGEDTVAVAAAVLAAPRAGQPTRDVLLLDGVAKAATQGYAVGVPIVHEALAGFRTVSAEEGLGWLPLACRMAGDTWDSTRWTALTASLVDLARATGALSVLPLALLLRVANRAFVGELGEAESLAAEVVAVGDATGAGFLGPYGALFVEPWRGREAATYRAIESLSQNVLTRGQPKVESDTQWATAVLYNGLGRYDEAQVAARLASETPDDLGLSIKALPEFVEASARLGRPDDAADAVRKLTEMAEATGTDWALGTAARVRALLSQGEAADDLHREAIERLGRTEVRMDLARARLCYGEWLRRENRRTDARAELGAAHESLSGFGAEGFAERARRELLATGATVRKRSQASYDALTSQEEQIARLAGDGLTNPEIGARLFISPHTVDWHLRKVFSKLGISSRRQLRGTLNASAPA